MSGKGALRVIICGSLMGLTIGLLVVFYLFMGAFMTLRTTPPEVSQDQKQQAFMLLARNEWSSKQNDPEYIEARIASVQAVTGDMDGAKQTTDKLGKFDKNLVWNV